MTGAAIQKCWISCIWYSLNDDPKQTKQKKLGNA